MKKKDLKNFMIVNNGLEEMFLVFKSEEYNDEWIIIRDLDESEQDLCNCEEEGLRAFESIDFDDNLVCTYNKPASIVEVYDSLPIEAPFTMAVKELFNEYKPELLWKRKPTNLSASKLYHFETDKEKFEYLNSLVPPYFITE